MGSRAAYQALLDLFAKEIISKPSKKSSPQVETIQQNVESVQTAEKAVEVAIEQVKEDLIESKPVEEVLPHIEEVKEVLQTSQSLRDRILKGLRTNQKNRLMNELKNKFKELGKVPNQKEMEAKVENIVEIDANEVIDDFIQEENKAKKLKEEQEARDIVDDFMKEENAKVEEPIMEEPSVPIVEEPIVEEPIVEQPSEPIVEEPIKPRVEETPVKISKRKNALNELLSAPRKTAKRKNVTPREKIATKIKTIRNLIARLHQTYRTQNLHNNVPVSLVDDIETKISNLNQKYDDALNDIERELLNNSLSDNKLKQIESTIEKLQTKYDTDVGLIDRKFKEAMLYYGGKRSKKRMTYKKSSQKRHSRTVKK